MRSALSSIEEVQAIQLSPYADVYTLVFRPGVTPTQEMVQKVFKGCAFTGRTVELLDDPKAPRAPPADPPDSPATPGRIALGKRLFTDKRMSADGSIACASCHQSRHAFASGSATAIGLRGRKMSRNVPTLLNVGYRSPIFWDGRANTLEEVTLRALQHPAVIDMTPDELVERLRSIPEYVSLFRQEFGEPPTIGAFAMALAAYQRGFVSDDTPFDRFATGDGSAISQSARRGWDVFCNKANCITCHAGPDFTDEEFRSIGIGWDGASFRDSGRGKITGKPEHAGKFRVPPLRELRWTAPYMHDGSLKSLGDVVDYYDRGGTEGASTDLKGPLKLSGGEKTDLVAFLESLSSPTNSLGFGEAQVGVEATVESSHVVEGTSTRPFRTEASGDTGRVQVDNSTKCPPATSIAGSRSGVTPKGCLNGPAACCFRKDTGPARRAQIVSAQFPLGAGEQKRRPERLDAAGGVSDANTECCPSKPVAACCVGVDAVPNGSLASNAGDMALIPAGEFLRGGKWKVRVGSFYMDRYEVTNHEYCQFLNANPERAGFWNEKQEIERIDGKFCPKPGKEKWPVYAVAWHEAAAYTAWADKRLPTEAEWEYAAGGRRHTKYPWGDEPLTLERANYGGHVGHPVAVGSYPAGKTPDGVYDLSGNVAEWCADWFDSGYYTLAPVDCPTGPKKGKRHVRRGGCFAMDAEAQERASRGSSPPLYRPRCIGFRGVRSSAPCPSAVTRASR